MASHQFSRCGSAGRGGSSCSREGGRGGRATELPVLHTTQPLCSPETAALQRGRREASVQCSGMDWGLTSVAEEGEVYVVEESS